MLSYVREIRIQIFCVLPMENLTLIAWRWVCLLKICIIFKILELGQTHSMQCLQAVFFPPLCSHFPLCVAESILRLLPWPNMGPWSARIQMQPVQAAGAQEVPQAGAAAVQLGSAPRRFPRAAGRTKRWR